jgi:hypothetical protein
MKEAMFDFGANSEIFGTQETAFGTGIDSGT